MSQVSFAVRMRTYRENYLDSSAWGEIVAKMKAGERVSGNLPLVKPLTDIRDWCRIAVKEVGDDPTTMKKALPKSMRDGLLDDIAQLMAQTSILKVNGVEMTGEEWFLPKLNAPKSKVKYRDYYSHLNSAVKDKSVKIVHTGVSWEVADALTNFTASKRGKAKKSIVRAIADI